MLTCKPHTTRGLTYVDDPPEEPPASHPLLRGAVPAAVAELVLALGDGGARASRHRPDHALVLSRQPALLLAQRRERVERVARVAAAQSVAAQVIRRRRVFCLGAVIGQVNHSPEEGKSGSQGAYSITARVGGKLDISLVRLWNRIVVSWTEGQKLSLKLFARTSRSITSL